ncbi:unnamed protein product [Vitrella brassicaformis CCMP3155]|uniref:Uncharacterized protein n=1 Tax=Vitrella brassicaformis (strain CCMP3155) TaxID=1169540 RepID=A0A0G4EC94_VITBC|nr:unnamed protein product [Vitrella brassicaformis CCMP3155]|eukprot:CEL92963.1 unnamed protein product [Vitrella brassicaformis CCMP3155]
MMLALFAGLLLSSQAIGTQQPEQPLPNAFELLAHLERLTGVDLKCKADDVQVWFPNEGSDTRGDTPQSLWEKGKERGVREAFFHALSLINLKRTAEGSLLGPVDAEDVDFLHVIYCPSSRQKVTETIRETDEGTLAIESTGGELYVLLRPSERSVAAAEDESLNRKTHDDIVMAFIEKKMTEKNDANIQLAAGKKSKQTMLRQQADGSHRLTFSPQDLVRCITKHCNGGNPHVAFERYASACAALGKL